jgi:hypothetical protein
MLPWGLEGAGRAKRRRRFGSGPLGATGEGFLSACRCKAAPVLAAAVQMPDDTPRTCRAELVRPVGAQETEPALQRRLWSYNDFSARIS